MKKAILTSFMLFATLLCIAQISYENRIEIELKDGYKKEKIIDFGENGFVLHSQKRKTSGNKTTWRYEMFDTDLKSIKKVEVAIDNKAFRSPFPSFVQTDTHIHSFYKNKKGNYTIVTIEIPSLEITKIEGQLPAQTLIGTKAVIGDHLFLEAFGRKNTRLLLINWKTGKQKLIDKILDNFDANQISIVKLITSEDRDKLIIHLESKKGKRKKLDYLAFFDISGNKAGELDFSKINNTEQNILNVSANKIDNQQIIAGTYGKGEYSSGVYFSASKDKSSSLNTYKFTDLEDFFGYMGEKAQEKIKRKKEKIEQKGRKLDISYLMAMHEVIPVKDGYLLIGEAYYPTYQHKSVTDGNGNRTYQRVFDGFQYTHATVMKFDYEGNLKWDKSFRMNIIHRPRFTGRHICVTEKDENSVKLIFITDNILKSKKISHDGETLQDEKGELIDTGNEGDKEKWTISNMKYWYDNYFIIYGEQKIKNKKDNEKRRVFFVSKIKYE